MPTYPLARATAVTTIAGLIGLVTHLATEALGWEFPSFGEAAGTLIWKLGVLAIVVIGLRRWEQRRPDAEALGWSKGPPRRDKWRTVLLGLAGCVALAIVLGALFPSAASGDSYGDVHKAGAALALFELLVRYPVTVFAEESFFRGWLQPRLPLWPPVVSGILFAAFHLQQASTIPSLIPVGIALGIVRWYTGDVRAPAALHYASNAAFFLSTYV